jgi:hypothetical protein
MIRIRMNAAPKTIVISASNDKYMVVANDLFMSLRDKVFQFPFDLGLLDVGLSDAARQHFGGQGIKIAAAKQDIDFPGRAAWEAARPAVRTLTARPFLRDYFPGYDVYVWLDADVWVQTPDALNAMIASAAQNDAIHLSAEIDRCYQPLFRQDGIWHMYHDWYRVNYGQAIAEAMLLMPMLNAGVFAMSAASPVWQAWGKIYADVLQNLPEVNDKTFMADQLGLNILIYMHKMPSVILPASFNWLTFFALPFFDKAIGLYVEPTIPHRLISQIHLTRPRKLGVEQIRCTDGSIIERSLMYSARAL